MGKISDRDSERLGLSDEARRAHEQSIVIDLHVDSVIQQRLFGYDLTREHDPGQRMGRRAWKYDLLRWGARLAGNHRPFFGHADIPRLRRAGYDAVALSTHYWPRQSERAWNEINQQIDYIHEIVDRSPELVLAHGPADVREASAAEKLAVLIAVEGLHCLGASGSANAARRLHRVETLFARGVRYITVVHFSRNDAAIHGYGPGGDPQRGLSSFGRELLATMNEVGMIVDVAHVSRRGVLEICEASRRPVIASHSGFAGVHPQRRDRKLRRLLDDEGMLAVARSGGTIGIILAPLYLSGRKDGLRCVAEHLRYGFTQLGAALANTSDGRRAEDHFSIGSDLDGWLRSIPAELNDVADMPLLTQTLLQAGFSPEQVRKIWGENFLRGWERVLSG